MPLEHKLLLRRPSLARLFQLTGLAVVPTQLGERPLHPHAHDVHEAVLVRSGVLQHDIAGHQMESPRGSFDLVPLKSIHRYTSHSKTCEIINILIAPQKTSCFPKGIMSQNLHTKNPRICQLQFGDNPKLWYCIDQILLEQQQQSFGWEQAINLHFETLFLCCERAIHEKQVRWFEDRRASGVDPKFEALLQRIDSNPQHGWNLNMIARELQLSKEYTCRRFQQRCKCTVHYYVSRRRVELAQELLVNKQSVEQAALQAGFNSVLAAYRAFKLISKLSPRQWLKVQQTQKP